MPDAIFSDRYKMWHVERDAFFSCYLQRNSTVDWSNIGKYTFSLQFGYEFFFTYLTFFTNSTRKEAEDRDSSFILW